MQVYMADPFQVRALEKKIGRALTESEREGHEPVRIKDSNGRVRMEYVKRHNMRDFYGK